MVIGSSGLSPKSQPKDDLAQGRLQPHNTKVIPVQVAQDGRLVQVPESEMNET